MLFYMVLMDLELKSENIDEHIDSFKTEEIARAAIVEANYKCFLEKQLEKTYPRDDEQILDLAMEAISNQMRNVSPSPKGGFRR